MAASVLQIAQRRSETDWTRGLQVSEIAASVGDGAVTWAGSVGKIARRRAEEK